MIGLLGKKLGMTQIYDESVLEPVTVIEAGPCRVVAIKTPERDRYEAVQPSFGEVKERKLSRGELGHLKKQQAPVGRYLRELKKSGDVSVGQINKAALFKKGDWVDVIGVSKGKGYQGVVRRHHFNGGRASHGGGWHRRTGSIGMKAEPGQVYKGRRMPAQLRAQIDANEASHEAQRALAQNQAAELVRINALYDAELDRLKRLWGGAQPGSLGPTAAADLSRASSSATR